MGRAAIQHGMVLVVGGVEMNAEAAFHLYGWAFTLGLAALISVNLPWILRVCRTKTWRLYDMLPEIEALKITLDPDILRFSSGSSVGLETRIEQTHGKLTKLGLPCPSTDAHTDTWWQYLTELCIWAEDRNYRRAQAIRWWDY